MFNQCKSHNTYLGVCQDGVDIIVRHDVVEHQREKEPRVPGVKGGRVLCQRVTSAKYTTIWSTYHSASLVDLGRRANPAK